MSKYRVIQWGYPFLWYIAQKRVLWFFWTDVGDLRTNKDAAIKDIEIHKNRVVYEERV